MKRLLCIFILALGLAFAAQAQLAAPPSTPAPGAPTPLAGPPGAPAAPQLKISLTAVAATNQGEKTDLASDSSLSSVKALLDGLPYSHFERVATHEVKAQAGEETKIPINGIYTSYVQPGIPRGQLIELAARIETLQGDRYVDALRTTAQAAPGKPLVFRGLELPHGELVVILSLSPDSDGQKQQNQQDQSQDKEQKEQQNQDQQKQQEQQQEQQEQQAQNQQQEQQNQQQEQQKQEGNDESSDKQNVEAILQSLEEIDREEQKQVQNVPGNFRVKGDWW